VHVIYPQTFSADQRKRRKKKKKCRTKRNEMQNKQQQTNNLRTALSITCPEANYIQGKEEEQL